MSISTFCYFILPLHYIYVIILVTLDSNNQKNPDTDNHTNAEYKIYQAAEP